MPFALQVRFCFFVFAKVSSCKDCKVEVITVLFVTLCSSKSSSLAVLSDSISAFSLAGRRSPWPFEMGEFEYSTQMAQPQSSLCLLLTFAVQISEVLIPPLIGPAT